MIKVRILDKCPHCKGQAMLPVGEGKDYKGRTYTRYAPCPKCEGSGQQTLTTWRNAVEISREKRAADLPFQCTRSCRRMA